MPQNKRSVLITGAARRLGRALALAMAEEAPALLLHAHRSRRELEALAKSLRHKGIAVTTFYADLKDARELGALLRALAQLPGPPAVAILSAASFLRKSLRKTSLEEWDEVLRLNLRAPVVLAEELGRRMKAMGWGRIVFIGDSLGLVPFRGYAVHSLAKGALIPAIKILAEELAPEVTVNMVAPGAVLPPEDYSPAQVRRTVARTLLKRLGDPQDVVEAVRFLIRCSYITGAVIPVDGGRSLKG